jgi:hypothetical protein
MPEHQSYEGTWIEKNAEANTQVINIINLKSNKENLNYAMESLNIYHKVFYNQQ